ncbi:hypothetical protein MBIO_0549 [Mycoplasmopsis fermentans PG18]|uniref:Uncharacterized protein n=3 Tax=Mycoplasmopsis fermentans TaxID=2115 RepID=C4XF92_MYCFP|nr:hypothetical protein [Mycoplasmopsis fermentans]VEU67328.1 Uncharacterised protein [Mesomycoplasma conjunctivae]AAN85233.1 ORF700 [Mycoplasmopsis fermentans]ADV34855.1 Hypothetical Protein MfeM64YM_0860 [Mycoplasmopsis fermentans M64]VEU63962.1 Uncharacterised protein [Mycoplasmopsis fermentans]BAH69814.1 hypothetical protein MBIO_0549 [Mycoplasmopsis fermentans PG18]
MKKIIKIIRNLSILSPIPMVLNSCSNTDKPKKQEEQEEKKVKEYHVPTSCVDYDKDELKNILEKNTKLVKNVNTNKKEKYIDYDFVYDVIQKWYIEKNGNQLTDVFYFPAFNAISIHPEYTNDNVKLFSSYLFSSKDDLISELNWINNNEEEAKIKYSNRNFKLSEDENLKKIKSEIEKAIELRKNKKDIKKFKKIVMPSNFLTMNSNDNFDWKREFSRISLLNNCEFVFDSKCSSIFFHDRNFGSWELKGRINLSEFNNVKLNYLDNSKDGLSWNKNIYFYLNNFIDEEKDIIVDKNIFNMESYEQFNNVKIRNLYLRNFKYSFNTGGLNLDYLNIAKKLKVKKLIIDKDLSFKTSFKLSLKNTDFEDIEGAEYLIKNLYVPELSGGNSDLFIKLLKNNKIPKSFKIKLKDYSFPPEENDLYVNCLYRLFNLNLDLVDLSDSDPVNILYFGNPKNSQTDNDAFNCYTDKVIYPKKVEKVEGAIAAHRFKNIKFWKNVGFNADNFIYFFDERMNTDDCKTLEFEEFENVSKPFEMLNNAFVLWPNGNKWNKPYVLTIKINNLTASTLNPIYNITLGKEYFDASHYKDILDVNTLNFTFAEKSLMGFKTVRCLNDNFDVFKSLNMTKVNHEGKEKWFFKNHADYFNVPVYEYRRMKYNELSFTFECKDGTYLLKPDEDPYFAKNGEFSSRNYLTYNIQKIK